MQPDIRADADFGEAVGSPRSLLPLAGLARILTILLAGDMVVAVAVRVVQARGTGLWSPAHLQTAQGPYVVTARLALVATVIVFLVWFRRAGINAESRGIERRYGRSWAFWGWLVPILNFWIPFQLMDDLLRASRPSWPRARKTWLPMAWWVTWTLFEYAQVVQRGRGSMTVLVIGYRSPVGHASPGSHLLPAGWPGLALFVVAGLTCLALVRAISSGELGRNAPDRPPVLDAGDV